MYNLKDPPANNVSQMITNLFNDGQNKDGSKVKNLNSDEPPLVNKSSGLDINPEFKSSNIIDKSMYSEIIGTSNQLQTNQTEPDFLTQFEKTGDL